MSSLNYTSSTFEVNYDTKEKETKLRSFHGKIPFGFLGVGARDVHFVSKRLGRALILKLSQMQNIEES